MCFREELLGLIPLEGQTTGEVIFQKIVSFFNENELYLQKVCLLVTDGVPAMVGLHCIINQSVLCGDLKNTMDTVMNTEFHPLNLQLTISPFPSAAC